MIKLLITPLVIALTLSLFTVSASLAQGYSGSRPLIGAAYKTGVYTTVEGKLRIALDKETGGSVRITLIANGMSLFAYEVGKRETTNRSCFDLNDLPDGAYELKITNGIETTWHTITLSSRQPVTHSRLMVVN